MDLFQKLLLTVLVAAIVSFILAKLFSVATSATGGHPGTNGVAEVESLVRAQRREIEMQTRVHLSEEGVEKVDKFSDEGRTELDEVAGGNIVAGKIDELVMVDDEIVKDFGSDDDSFDDSGDVFENIERIGTESVIMVSEEKVVEHLVKDDEVVGDVGVENDRYESSGGVCENSETIGLEGVITETLEAMVDDMKEENVVAGGYGEKIVEHVDEIVGNVGNGDDCFGNSGVISEKVEDVGGESDIMVNLVSSDHVVDDEFGVEKMSVVGRKSDELDDVDGESAVVEAFGAIAKVVEYVKPDSDENAGERGLEGDIMMNLGANDGVPSEVVVQEEIDKRKIKEKIVESKGVDSDSSQNMANLGENDHVTNQDDNVAIGIEEEKDEKNKVFSDDDWEGIERSELEESFAAAANYVLGGDKNVSELESDVKMELYGLNKVALEGPCREAQPMAIKVAARAKWNAWQKLGNMSPEDAMEQYISLLSDKAPDWKEDKSPGDSSKDLLSTHGAPPPDIGTCPEKSD